jgi:hypothetical protein
MFRFKKTVSWQASKKNSGCKADLIQKELMRLGVQNILDIGTNAGAVGRLLSPNFFVVGIDSKLDTRGYEKPFTHIALGEISFNSLNAQRIPAFDAVLLLSVHHQWLAELPEKEADLLVKKAISIAKKAAFIEFAALNSKYSRFSKFVDNDEKSILKYAFDYLNRLQTQSVITYLGKCSESDQEPFRFLFMIEKLL